MTPAHRLCAAPMMDWTDLIGNEKLMAHFGAPFHGRIHERDSSDAKLAVRKRKKSKYPMNERALRRVAQPRQR